MRVASINKKHSVCHFYRSVHQSHTPKKITIGLPTAYGFHNNTTLKSAELRIVIAADIGAFEELTWKKNRHKTVNCPPVCFTKDQSFWKCRYTAVVNSNLLKKKKNRKILDYFSIVSQQFRWSIDIPTVILRQQFLEHSSQMEEEVQ